MKKILCTLIALMAIVISTNAYDFEKFSVSGGAELNANYLFRGNVLGGISVQPWIEFSAYGITLGAWGSYGSGTYDNFKDNSTNKEFDMFVSYTTPSDYVTLKITHFYYFDGSKFFNYSYDKEKYGSSQTEVMCEIKPSSDYPFVLSANVQVGGGDCLSYNTAYLNYGKQWTTYISLRYELEIDKWYIEPEIGFSPWKSNYTYFNPDSGVHSKFAMNNISCKVNYNFFTSDYVSMYMLAHVHFNLFDVGYEKFEYQKNFGWNVGIGILL